MASRKINLIDFNTNIYKEDTEQPTGFSSSRVKVEADESDVESNFGAGTQQNASDFSFSEPETENAITIFKLKDEGEPDKSVDIKRESDEDCEEDEEDSEDEALPPAAFVSVVKEERPWTPDSQPCSSKNTSNEPMETNEESPTFSGFSPVPETQDPLLIDSSEGRTRGRKRRKVVSITCDGKDVKVKSKPKPLPSLDFLYERDPKVEKPKTFECTFCDYTTNRRKRLEAHTKTHNDEDYMICDKCDYRTKRPQAFRNHKRNHELPTSLKCDQCNFIAPNQGLLTSHIITHTKPFACHFCTYRADRSHHLMRHLNKHVNETVRKEHKCELCDFKHHLKAELTNHYIAAHREYKRFQCDLCDFKTAYPGCHRSHRQTHFPEKLFSCDQCDYKTNKNSLLASHKLHKHNNGKRFSCKLCTFTSYFKYSMDTHVKKHVRKAI